MTKLLNAYRNNRSVANMTKLLAYLDKHMMAECMASDEERSLIQEARTERSYRLQAGL